MQTMEFIADVYGGDYSQFESDMNAMLSKKEGQISSANLSPSDLKNHARLNLCLAAYWWFR